MTIPQAIEKAVAGGWKEGMPGYEWTFIGANKYWVVWKNANGTETSISLSLYVLNPDFWRALGKTEGWDTEDYETHHLDEKPLYEWQYRMHDLIDHLADGGTIESYFESL